MSNVVYEKPSIKQLEAGAMNKYGSSPYYARKVRKDIDGATIDSLVEEFGSPLFVFSEKTIRNKMRDTLETLKSHYPNIQFGWSYKTNYLNAICSIFHQEGSIAEVVSEMEYEKARNLGIEGKDIIYNGPLKSYASLKRAAEEGAKIHIDHFDEIDDLEKVAEEIGKEIPVAIRLNLDSGIRPIWSRFGFNLESGQALNAIKRINVGGKLRLEGLHCHLATFVLDPEAYKNQIRKMIAFGYEIEDSFGYKMKYYDIGGGFPSKSRLKGSLVSPETIVPTVESFAEAISEGLYSSLRPNDLPKVYLESGRALIDEAGYLITSVFTSKRFPDGRKSYVLDAGVNLLYTSTWYQFNIELDRELSGIGEVSYLNGPLCMNIDVVDEGTILPPMPRGTRLIMSPVGAYNVTQWMQFIEYRPAIVLVTEEGKAEVIREAEDLSDICNRERIPEHLTKLT